MGNNEGLELDEADEDEELCEGDCRDSLLYEQWATTRDLSWMRLMKSRRWVKVMRSKWRRTKAKMWEGSRVVGVDKRIV